MLTRSPHKLTAAVFVAVSFLCLFPFGTAGEEQSGLLSWIEMFDKIGHAALFGFLAFVLWQSIEALGFRGPVIWASILSSAYGFAIELIQGRIPERCFDPLDLAANSAGVVLFVGWAYVKRSKRA